MHTALFDAIPDALVIVDAAGNILMANRTAYRMFGYDAPALVGLRVENLIPEELRAAHQRHRKTYTMQPRERAMGQARMALLGRRRDGSQFPVEVALNPLKIGEQPQILASIRDVSNTVIAQRVQRKTLHDEALLEIGHRIVASAGQDEVLQDVACELADAVAAGPAWILLSERTTDTVTAYGLIQPPADWLATEARPLLHALTPVANLLSKGERLGNAKLPDGMRTAIALPLVLANGSVVGAIAAFSRELDAFDADVRRMLETASSLLSAMLQRQASTEALVHAQRLEAIGKLTGGVAHDFNNLLTVISGNLQILESQVEDSTDACEALSAAVRAVDQGAALTRKLLSFAGRQHLRPALVSLGQQVRELERLMRATLGKRVRISFEIEPRVAPVRVDPALFDSVVLNLVLNARDAIEDTGEVWLSVREEWIDADNREGIAAGRYVTVRVRDSGCGMGPDTLAHAWEPFFTTKSGGRGTGLGLSMVYGFMHQSGGDVHLESRLGLGTAVTLYFPVVIGDEVEASHERPPVTGGNEVVLVVEDDPAVRSTVEATLKSLGYRVVSTASADDALQCLRSVNDIALLFTDLTLEGPMTGTDLAREARRTHPRLAVLVTSGFPGAQEALGEEFAMLAKPYHKDDLARAVRAALSEQ